MPVRRDLDPLATIGHIVETIAEPDGRLRPTFAAAGVELHARASRAFHIES